jgi:hypothetical protein
MRTDRLILTIGNDLVAIRCRIDLSDKPEYSTACGTSSSAPRDGRSAARARLWCIRTANRVTARSTFGVSFGTNAPDRGESRWASSSPALVAPGRGLPSSSHSWKFGSCASRTTPVLFGATRCTRRSRRCRTPLWTALWTGCADRSQIGVRRWGYLVNNTRAIPRNHRSPATTASPGCGRKILRPFFISSQTAGAFSGMSVGLCVEIPIRGGTA